MPLPSAQAATALEVLTFRGGFNTNVVIAGTTLLGLAAGVIGVFMLLRKRSLTTDALAHATLPGIVAAFLIAGALGLETRSLPILLAGAATTAALAAVAIQAILKHSRLHEDAAIGIVLSGTFALGIVGLSYIQSNAPRGSGGLEAFILGQAAAMNPTDVALMAAVAAAVIIATLLLSKELTLVCFDAAFARVDGWPTAAIDLIMMALVVLVTVAGLQAVGLILVIALLIVPPVAARFWSDRLSTNLAVAAAIGAASGYTGSALSALAPNRPAGAVIVLVAGAFFIASLLLAPKKGLVANAARRLALRVKIAGDHLLEYAHDLGTPSLTHHQIAALAKRRGWSPVFTRLIRLTLSAAAMTRPNDQGLDLTTIGAQRGARVARTHDLWEQYLITYADIAPTHVDWSVDQVEHVLSDELIRELETRLDARLTKEAAPA